MDYFTVAVSIVGFALVVLLILKSISAFLKVIIVVFSLLAGLYHFGYLKSEDIEKYIGPPQGKVGSYINEYSQEVNTTLHNNQGLINEAKYYYNNTDKITDAIRRYK